jgi:hypothetical protein
MNDQLEFDPAAALRGHAEQLNAICSPARAPKVHYELLSGALIFSDETTRELPWEVIGALRMLFAYRTSVMLGQPKEDLKGMWDLGSLLFPNWVGFRPERREAIPELLNIWREGTVRSRKCLRDLERKLDMGDEPTAAGSPSLPQNDQRLR